MSRFNPFEGYVGSDSVGQDILISGRVDMNRAMDGAQGRGPGGHAWCGCAGPGAMDEGGGRMTLVLGMVHDSE